MASSSNASPAPSDKNDIRSFWGAVYRSAYAEPDSELTGESLREGLVQLEDMFRLRRHLAVTEMDLARLAGKRVLEIGSGAGGHSALFASHGAQMTSVDITLDRVRATRDKYRLMVEAADGCVALQADAEHLPFADGSFDIVYSNGVLHHTHDTEAAIAEAGRVLKPGGRAVIMLYCKSSFHYWFTLWFCVGLLRGAMFRGEEWVGRATEWIGTAPQTEINPVTRSYSAAGIRRLFSSFHDVRLRKADFTLCDVPKLGRLWRRWLARRYGRHPGGRLVYGHPWLITAAWERALGRAVGWAWNITAVKPTVPGSAGQR